MKLNLKFLSGLVLAALFIFSCSDNKSIKNEKQNSITADSLTKITSASVYDTILNPSFSKVEELIKSSINDSAFPGAVLLIWKGGKIIFQKSFGHLTYNDSSAKVKTNTIYDLASLTKVIATTTSTMICIDRKLFKLEDKVSKFIPGFAQKGKENITLKNLLLHNSGLPAYKRFYMLYNNSNDVLNDIYSTKLTYTPGTKTVYSDLGMIVLGKVIEKVTGKALDEFCNENIFKPLQMNDTYFNPPSSLKYRIAPTEVDNYWRNRLIIGEVHDENSSLLNGVAGHAGLFSTAGDISRFLQMLLQKGNFEGKRLIDSSTVKLFTTKQSDERALGWDIKSTTGSSAGNFLSNKSYGHTGFTGTSIWTDPTRDLFIIFLTNRVYPTRENNKIIKIRPELSDLIIRAIKN
ncbi:MAG TPA: serine hydrolase [Ignavibacteriaceae bacterium]|nr:serine hydrolase [Ignavibacteriaceae bacterium]